jgi:hypothetical protein
MAATCSLAAVTIESGIKPNLRCNSFNGADAPNVFMPIMRPRFPMEIPERAALNFSFCLRVGRVEDALNGFIQHGVELRIGLLSREPFRKGPRKARDDALIAAQAVIGFFSGIAAR